MNGKDGCYKCNCSLNNVCLCSSSDTHVFILSSVVIRDATMLGLKLNYIRMFTFKVKNECSATFRKELLFILLHYIRHCMSQLKVFILM